MSRLRLPGEKKTLMLLARLVILVALVASLPSSIQAQENDNVGVGRKPGNPRPARVLNGHFFTPNTVLNDPWVLSSFWIGVGGGLAQGTQTTLKGLLQDEILLSGDAGFLAGGGSYQVAFNDWFEWRFGGNGAARFGANAEALISQGVEGGFGFMTGPSFRLVQREKFILSASADVAVDKVFLFNVLTLVDQVIESGFDLGQKYSVVDTGTAKTFIGGAQFAYALNPTFGFNATTRLGVGSSPLVDKDDFIWSYGGSFDTDFAARTKIPMAVEVGAQYRNFHLPFISLIDHAWTTFLNVGYSGRTDLYTGVEVKFSRAIPSAENVVGTIEATAVGVVLRYYY